MKLREFLNTTNVDWVNLRLWRDDIAYSAGESEKYGIYTYTDMRDIPDWMLNESVDNWDVGAVLTREGQIRFFLDVLI